jgi:hypothetical protein
MDAIKVRVYSFDNTQDEFARLLLCAYDQIAESVSRLKSCFARRLRGLFQASAVVGILIEGISLI